MTQASHCRVWAQMDAIMLTVAQEMVHCHLIICKRPLKVRDRCLDFINDQFCKIEYLFSAFSLSVKQL